MLSLNDRDWCEFKIGDLFEISRGKAKNISSKYVDGNIAIISALDNNNGLYSCATIGSEDALYKNVLTVNNNGNGVCISYYHKYQFIASSDVSILIHKFYMTEARALFIANQIKQQKTKYNYGYKMANSRLRQQTILLPVTVDGMPDYEFMEQYIHDIINRKHAEYRSFLNKQTNKHKGVAEQKMERV